jgi:glycosyltransferase involved in cell wall biosynthesis
MNVSACITSYNQSRFLVEAIDSVLAQTLPPAEILIVDDASSDESPAIIAAYAARYPDLIRPILRQRNQGVAATFNEGLASASGDYLSFLAGDDRWLPAKLERETERLTAADRPDGVYGDFYFTDASGARRFRWANGRRPPEGHVLPQVLGRDYPRRTLFRAELVNLSLWRQAGGFDPTFGLYEDWDMKIALAARLRFGYVDAPLSEYRRHGQGLSMADPAAHLAATDHIERKHAALYQSLASSHGPYLRRQLASWRAHLLRSGARATALRHGGSGRAEALRLYRQSLTFQRRPDIRLLWYLMRGMLYPAR